MVNPRQPAEARSSTAHTSFRQECSPGSRPITLTRRRVSPKVRSMKFECRTRVQCSRGNRQVHRQRVTVIKQAPHRRRIFVGSSGFVALIALSICTAIIASRAARAADDHADYHSTLSPAASRSVEKPSITDLFSQRATTIVGWIIAVAASGVTAFLFITLIDGYVLASHHQLQPNDTFGFRDATTRSCLPAWYAAQKAGFSWVLFGYGPILALSILLTVVAAIRRSSPWDVVAVVMGTLFLLIFVVVIGGVHADNAARAIACRGHTSVVVDRRACSCCRPLRSRSQLPLLTEGFVHGIRVGLAPRPT
jgi:tetrahydromethanopterin S-methyltransferase subunit E